MTLDERVHKLWEATGCSWNIKECKDHLRRALIEQDKITRHAAAEAIMAVDFTERFNRYDTKNACHSAVMNCRGGVE